MSDSSNELTYIVINKCKFLIDTGATNSLVNPNVFHQSKIVQLKGPKEMLALKNSHIVTHKAVVKAFREFNLPNQMFEFYVYNFNNNFEGLIGNDILLKNKAIINYEGMYLLLNGSKLPLLSEKITTKVKITIPPGEQDCKICLPLENGDVLINNIMQGNGIILNEGLYKCENGEVCVKINNKSNKPIVLDTGVILTYEEISEIHNINDISGKINSEIIDVDSVLKKIRTEHLNSKERLELEKLIRDFKVLLSDNGKLTFTHEIKHTIDTTDEIPIRSKIYRYPYIYKDEIQKQILEMLSNGIIAPSSSPYNSPVWVVPKKSDASGMKKFRLVIDYRKLNDKTIEDNYPIPNITDILDKLGKSNYFSILDLKSGFHQIEVHEKDRQKTAFSVDNGHYEFNRMPFGLKNAPSTFQRLVDNILRENVSKRECMVYMDDIIVFSNGLEEHVKNLKSVLNKLRNARLKIQLDKCEFFRKEVEFLGHTVNEEGVSPNQAKIEVIRKLQIPRTEKEIKRFLGMTGYYRRFIKNYAHITKPMTKYLKKDSILDIKDINYIDAFNILKEKLVHAPILVYPDFSLPFEITTDASNVAIGGVLSQNDKPIAYVSRTLNEHEINYSTIEKECLGIVWCLKQFRPYVYGRKIKLFTDHKPLIWLNNLKEPNSKLMRWRLQIGEYDYEINYKEGHLNKVADCLSRIEINNTISSNQNFNNNENLNSIKELQKPINIYDNQVIFQKIISGAVSIRNSVIHNHKRKVIKAKEFDDDFLKTIIENHFDHEKTNALFVDDDIFNKLKSILFKDYSNLKIVRCLKKLIDILDEEYLEEIISNEHLKNNHRGCNENYKEIKDKYYYPYLYKKVSEFINNCEVCMLSKYERNPDLVPYKISETPRRPHEIIHMDVFYSINKSIFVTMIDKFSKVALITRVTNRSDPEFRKCILRYLSSYGNIEKIVTDNELGMKSHGMMEFLKEKNIEINFTSSLNHNSNSDIERLHNTINEHLRILKQSKIDISIEEQMIQINGFYNHTIHSTTNIKPIDFIQGKINESQYPDIYDRMLKKKEQVINKLNESRIGEKILEDGINYIKETRGGKNYQKFRKIEGRKIDDSHLKDQNSKQIYYKTHVKKKKKFQNAQNVRFPVQQTTRRGNAVKRNN